MDCCFVFRCCGERDIVSNDITNKWQKLRHFNWFVNHYFDPCWAIYTYKSHGHALCSV